MIDSSSIKIYGDNMMSQKLTSYLQNWQARQATARNTRKVWVVCRPLSAVLGRYHPYHTIPYHTIHHTYHRLLLCMCLGQSSDDGRQKIISMVRCCWEEK